MDVTIKIKRFDPEAEQPESYWEDFDVSVPDKRDGAGRPHQEFGRKWTAP